MREPSETLEIDDTNDSVRRHDRMQGARRDQDRLPDHSAARALDRYRTRKADHDLGGEMVMRSGVAAKTFEAGPVLTKPNLPGPRMR